MTWVEIIMGAVTFLFAATYFFDKYFRTRKATERDQAMSEMKDRSWTPKERVELEHRLTLLEGDVRMLKEIQELRDKINASILKGSKSE